MTSTSVKQALRLEAMKRRDAAAAAAPGHTAAITRFAVDLLALTPDPAPVVSVYAAIGSELDPAPLAKALIARGAVIALPVIKGKAAEGRPLEFRVWELQNPLVERMWGIREPGPDAASVEPDILVVPLLLVDAAGNRIGYGGGYYDRTLSHMRATRKIIAIGLAHEAQRVGAVPHETYDQALDYVLTPAGLHRFGS